MGGQTMRGYRFYVEYADRGARRRGVHTGNVVALFVGEEHQLWGEMHAPGGGSERVLLQECLAAVLPQPNSPVARGRYKRVPERLAREIHPLLFERLDAPVVDAEGVTHV
jgi:hypothetical protein